MERNANRGRARWQLALLAVALVALLVVAWQGCGTGASGDPVLPVPESTSDAVDADERVAAKREKRRQADADRKSIGRAPQPVQATEPETAVPLHQPLPGYELLVRVRLAGGAAAQSGEALLLSQQEGSAVQWNAPPVLRAKIDAEGVARFTGLRANSYWLTAASGDSGALPHIVHVKGDSEANVILSDARRLSGQVLWGDGTPVASATLNVQFTVSETDHDHPAMIPGYVDNQGRFSLPAIPESALWRVSIRATAADRTNEHKLLAARRTWTLNDLPKDGVLRLTLAVRVGVGRVVDVHDNPVTDVYLSGEDGRGAFARVDAQGRFRLDLAAAQMGDVWVHGPDRIGVRAFPVGHAAFTSSATDAREVVLGDVRLAKSHLVSGQVLDPESEPVPLLTVALFRGDLKRPLLQKLAGEDGSFEFANVPPGTYRLGVVKPSRGSRLQTFSVREVTVNGPCVVNLEVVPDPESCRVVLRFEFSGDISRSYSGGFLAVRTLEDKPVEFLPFDLKGDEQQTAVMVKQPGTYKMIVQFPGYEAVELTEVHIARGKPNVLDVELRRKLKLR